MKFEINLNEDEIQKLRSAIEEAESNDCENMLLNLKFEIDKSERCKIIFACIYGECTEEYSSGNIL